MVPEERVQGTNLDDAVRCKQKQIRIGLTGQNGYSILWRVNPTNGDEQDRARTLLCTCQYGSGEFPAPWHV